MRTVREAAVLLAIFADPPHHVVFVERAAHLRDHPGQIGLPGGAVDLIDGDDRRRTALREFHEELGVGDDDVTIVSRLPTVVQRSNTYSVTPFVAVLRPGTPLVRDPAETAAIFTVPLSEIVTPGAVRPGIEIVGEARVDTWMFDYADRHIWGLTARMLRDFVVAWNLPDSPTRSAIQHVLHAGV